MTAQVQFDYYRRADDDRLSLFEGPGPSVCCNRDRRSYIDRGALHICPVGDRVLVRRGLPPSYVARNRSHAILHPQLADQRNINAQEHRIGSGLPCRLQGHRTQRTLFCKYELDWTSDRSKLHRGREHSHRRESVHVSILCKLYNFNNDKSQHPIPVHDIGLWKVRVRLESRDSPLAERSSRHQNRIPFIVSLIQSSSTTSSHSKQMSQNSDLSVPRL